MLRRVRARGGRAGPSGGPRLGRRGQLARRRAFERTRAALRGDRGRRVAGHFRGAGADGEPRRADDILGQAIAAQRVPAAYEPGLLAMREGRILAAAVARLPQLPDVLLVDATGFDHPRRAGLAVHLGAVVGVATVGVTERTLVASGSNPSPQRGARAPVHIGDRRVRFGVRPRTRARPVWAHAAGRPPAETASATVLAASTGAARTPVPLQEARRVAREARALAGAG